MLALQKIDRTAVAFWWRRVLELAPKPFSKERGPVATVADAQGFIARHGAFIAQTSLFGYLKTRMGTRYSEIFENAKFSKVIQKASANIFVSCAMDLTVYLVARIAADQPQLKPQAPQLASTLFDAAVRDGLAGLDVDVSADAAVEAFARRIAATDWTDPMDGEAAFAGSPEDLVRHAPVLDDLKELDSEVVLNSMRFRWQEVRRKLRARLDPASIAADWAAR